MRTQSCKHGTTLSLLSTQPAQQSTKGVSAGGCLERSTCRQRGVLRVLHFATSVFKRSWGLFGEEYQVATKITAGLTAQTAPEPRRRRETSRRFSTVIVHDACHVKLRIEKRTHRSVKKYEEPSPATSYTHTEHAKTKK